MSAYVSGAVWKSGPTDRMQRFVLLAIADNANDTGYAFPSREAIAEKCLVSERYVSQVIGKLVTLGWLTVIPKAIGHKGNAYVITLSKLRFERPDAVNPRTGRKVTTPKAPARSTPDADQKSGEQSSPDSEHAPESDQKSGEQSSREQSSPDIHSDQKSHEQGSPDFESQGKSMEKSGEICDIPPDPLLGRTVTRNRHSQKQDLHPELQEAAVGVEDDVSGEVSGEGVSGEIAPPAKKPRTPRGDADPRRKVFIDDLKRYWEYANPDLPFVFDARDGNATNRMLRALAGWTNDQLLRCLHNRAKSVVGHSDPIHTWIDNLQQYAFSPKNAYRNPTKGKGAKHDEQQQNIDTTRAVLSSFLAGGKEKTSTRGISGRVFPALEPPGIPGLSEGLVEPAREVPGDAAPEGI